MSVIVELRENLKKMVIEAGEIVNKADNDKRNLSVEERDAWDALKTNIDATKAQIEIEERKETQTQLEAELREVNQKVTPNFAPNIITSRKTFNADKAFANWALSGTKYCEDSADAAYRCAEFGFNMNKNEVEINPEYRALSLGSNSAGGYLKQTDFAATLGQQMQYIFPMMSICDFINTSDGNPIEFPFVDDTSNTAAAYSEAAGISSSQDPTFSTVTMGAYKRSSDIVKMSAELVQDERYNFTSRLAGMLAERLAKKLEADIVSTNAGTTAPKGIIACASDSGVSFDLQDGLTIDEFIDIEHSVSLAYRNSPGIGWLVNDKTVAGMRKLKSSYGVYYWEPSVVVGRPSTFLGYPVYVSNQMPSLATASAGDKLVLFGDFKQYTIRMTPLRVQRLNELYAGNDQIGIVAHQRWDARLTGSSSGLVYAKITDSGT